MLSYHLTCSTKNKQTKNPTPREQAFPDLFTIVSLSSRTVPGTEKAASQYIRVGEMQGGSRRKGTGRGWGEEGAEERIYSLNHVFPRCNQQLHLEEGSPSRRGRGSREKSEGETHFRTKKKRLIRSGQRSRGERERGVVLPWNITYLTISKRSFLKMSPGLGVEQVEVAFWSSKKKQSPDRQRLCAGMQSGERDEKQTDTAGQPGGHPDQTLAREQRARKEKQTRG